MARERRLRFGEVADLYDEVRPSYPPALVDDVIALAPMSKPRRALEVGAGTGKATVLFAERGVQVHALEPSAPMAALAERNTAHLPGVTIERVEFESWDPHGAGFPLIISAQAWHWISPDVGYAKARTVLVSGGLLAAFWNRSDWDSCPFRDELAAAYRRAIPERSGEDPLHPAARTAPDHWDEWASAIDATPGLDAAELRAYRWTRNYSTADYLALLRTHSPNIVLEDAQRDLLLSEVGRVLDDQGGEFTLDYVCWLLLAHAS